MQPAMSWTDVKEEMIEVVPLKTRRITGKKLSIPIHPDLAEVLAVCELGRTVNHGMVTREASLRQWVALQNDLGKAYRVRVHGERGNNLEKAITYFEAALTVRTQNFSEGVAQARANLGLAYGSPVRGERADNLDEAIKHFEAALTVMTREGEAGDRIRPSACNCFRGRRSGGAPSDQGGDQVLHPTD
jgi:hypothetical protein